MPEARRLPADNIQRESDENRHLLRSGRVHQLDQSSRYRQGNPRPTNAKWITKEGEKRGLLYEFFPQRYASSYERLLDHFVSKARSDEPFSVTIRDGLFSLALTEAARRSADNRLPISMSAIS